MVLNYSHRKFIRDVMRPVDKGGGLNVGKLILESRGMGHETTNEN